MKESGEKGVTGVLSHFGAGDVGYYEGRRDASVHLLDDLDCLVVAGFCANDDAIRGVPIQNCVAFSEKFRVGGVSYACTVQVITEYSTASAGRDSALHNDDEVVVRLGLDPVQGGSDLAEVRGAAVPGGSSSSDERDIADRFTNVVGVGEAQVAIRDSRRDPGIQSRLVNRDAARR